MTGAVNAEHEEFRELMGYYPTDWYLERGLPHLTTEQRREARQEHEARQARRAARGDDPRRSAIQNLIERGATEGERDAARAALSRIEAQDEEDYLDALRFGEA